MKAKVSVALSLLVMILLGPQAVLAHHGFGLYQIQVDKEWTGTLTRMELVNPHSYMYFDTTGAEGQPLSMRCEMRAATLIRRSGWSIDMFKPGSRVDIKGHPHRDDPHACYLESFTLNDAPAIDRNDQFSTNTSVDTSNRPLRLASGEPNISGDWAVEQSVLTIPPGGGHGDMVPKSLIKAYATGAMTLAQIRALTPPARALYTEKGQAAAAAFRMWSPEDNPRLSCKPTSIIYDWTFDWPINQIRQTMADGEKVIDISYGLYSFTRRIHLGMDHHPANLTPSNTGHSIGHWEGATLVVDTVGFAEGVLAPPTRNSEQLHVVERFTLDSSNMALKREYSATDPVYLTAPYATFDTVMLSDVPFEEHPCKELTPEFR